ncbi:threonine dehydratase [Pontibacillus halophilus JSM 076056 = DSM 19796]|uniref:L-threonine dehydratase catabolic TdcB n=1 Tax=Pontibacillus halophilus JSM 076056 = DSM 19796 TaxID=1385510 RepID=A0A0A5GKB4_9BACI|nr:threonine ammonia-lyase [Pontibacillus halophilus]KGX92434.1 threonine dehydratase [Pontibacillus halophilus JSM 076056 = DSM 19796]
MNHLNGVVHRTPLTTSETINKLTGKEVYLKQENQQKTGAFKVRGATYKISKLTKDEARRGVIAASAGNHAQGVALAATKRGIDAKIFMPEHTPRAKVQATEGYGAKVILTGESFQEAYQAALEEQIQARSPFLHPFDDGDVIAGQGTIALEMLSQQPNLDTLIVPIGGGGLISGMAVAAKSLKPSIRIIGVQATGASAMYNRFYQKGAPSLQHVSTIADGIAVKQPGELTSQHIRHFVDEIMTVSDEEIASAMIYLLERHKSLVEASGAAALAPLLSHRLSGRSKRCGIVISGGNMDVSKIPMIQQLAQTPIQKRILA